MQIYIIYFDHIYLSRVRPKGREIFFESSTYPPRVKTYPISDSKHIQPLLVTTLHKPSEQTS